MAFIAIPGRCMADNPQTPAEEAAEPAAVDRWTGFYTGGHFGYGVGGFGPGTHPVLDQGVFLPATLTGLLGGYQAGYNYHLPNGIVVGLEGDVTFTGPIDRSATGSTPFSTGLDYVATARSRFGYATGRFLPFVTGGIAWGETHVLMNAANDTSSRWATHAGWTAGAGLEYALDRHWSVMAEVEILAQLGVIGLLPFLQLPHRRDTVQAVAQPADVRPGLIGRQLLGKVAEFDRRFADAQQAKLRGIVGLAVGDELFIGQAGGIAGDGIDIVENVVEAIGGALRRQVGDPGRWLVEGAAGWWARQ
jgi:opacity protein-like surface antigen